jgi:hypothetical protein
MPISNKSWEAQPSPYVHCFAVVESGMYLNYNKKPTVHKDHKVKSHLWAIPSIGFYDPPPSKCCENYIFLPIYESRIH